MTVRQVVCYDIQVAQNVSGHYADVAGVSPKKKLSSVAVKGP